MAMKGTKNPGLSARDSIRDRAQARADAGVNASQMAGNEHLYQSKHFGADTTPKNPMSKMLPEKDGLPGFAASKAKGLIGG